MSTLRSMETFYTAQQVSQMTSMTVDWLWRQARDKKIPHHKLGGRYRWTESDLSALAEQSAVAPTGADDDDLTPARHSGRLRGREMDGRASERPLRGIMPAQGPVNSAQEGI